MQDTVYVQVCIAHQFSQSQNKWASLVGEMIKWNYLAGYTCWVAVNWYPFCATFFQLGNILYLDR